MDVMVKHNKVHIILQTQNSDVSHILQSNVKELKKSLQSQGLVVSNINVFSQEGSGKITYGFVQNGGLFREGRNPKEDRGNQREGRDVLSHDLSISGEEVLDLQKDKPISLFA